MGSFENTFISWKEYDSHRDTRLPETSFVVSELYTAMFALSSNKRRREAANLPLKLLETKRGEAGLLIASLGLLDIDLQQTDTVFVATFQDGFWADAARQIYIYDETNLHDPYISPLESYLLSYRGCLEDELDELGTGLSLPSQELAVTQASNKVFV